jgi:hypothetical protein
MADKQVGGMQEVFLQVKWKSMSGFERTVKVIEKLGGRVLHAYPFSVMVASVPSDTLKKLVGKGGILSVHTEAFSAKQVNAAEGKLKFAFTAWNDHFNLNRRMRLMSAPEVGIKWDETNRLIPDPPKEMQEELRRREITFGMGFAAALAEGAPNFSIPVMVGRIAVGLIYVDSTVAQYAISDQEKGKILSETIEGLNMLSGFEPRANIGWYYDIRRPKISLPASQFTGNASFDWEDKWRNAAMQALGFTPDINGMNAYINQIQASCNAKWAYAIFVSKYPSGWFAYEWSNHIYMHTGVDGWGIDNFNLVVAHESCHIFGVNDEYSSSACNCTQRGGRYQVVNGNCESCAAHFIPCLMAHNTAAVCDFTRGQLGWNELAVMSEGATTLKGTWTFDFEKGIQGPPTGTDIWWEQVNNTIRFLVPQNGAMLANLGKSDFDSVSYQTLQTQSYTTIPINGSNNASNTLTAGTVVAVKTNTGRYAKMKVETYGYNLVIRWVCYK